MADMNGNHFAGAMGNTDGELLTLRKAGFDQELMPARQRVELAKDDAGAELFCIRFRHSRIPMTQRTVKQR